MSINHVQIFKFIDIDYQFSIKPGFILHIIVSNLGTIHEFREKIICRYHQYYLILDGLREG